MSGVTSGECVNGGFTKQQIWPPSFDDPTLLNKPELVWDDSELVAHYNRVDAFVKQKLSAAYAQRTGRPLFTETTRDKPRASSQVGCPPRGSSRTRKPQTPRHSSPQTPFLTATNTTNASKQNAKKRMTNSQKINHASHSLEAALQSTRPVTTLSCDFEWLPPLLYPPDTLFDSSRSINRMNSSSTRRSQSHSKTVSKPKFPQQCTSTATTTATTTAQNYVNPSTMSVNELEQILQRWFQAGYNLGQEHALQLKQSTSKEQCTSNISA
ncbi:hypothetical protein CRM22_007518 [Opisthorchis felineus]|uniref:Uncharacterized protein n=1 Tax=Opisthorchis felineus TaxID=147828 RepID=A0A4S2LFH3_OPIFE|nr:hypothetical protein CRM22_007518 [Opisthorchis felineus]